MAHWTYAKFDPSCDLEQGDILSPTEPLRDLFSDIHPHFRSEKYVAYIVTTQSCDLVRRGELSKANYINIAVVRPLIAVTPKIFAQVAIPVGVGSFRSSDKQQAVRLLERVLNQNEQAIGLFFLHSDADAGIAEPAVAFLRVSIALRVEHYELLRSARVGKLTPEFRAKLGWLIGNLYVRPATSDWSDCADRKGEFQELVRSHLARVQWIDEEILSTARQMRVNIATATPEALEALRPPSPIERAISEVRAELMRVSPTLCTDTVTKLENRLRNNGKFLKLLRTQS